MKKFSAISMIAFMLLSILAVGVSAADPAFNPVVFDPMMSEGTTQDILLSATDADVGDVLTYSINNPPALAWVTISGATLRLAPDFAVTGSSASTFTITVRVSDGTGGPDTESFDVTVNPATPSDNLLVVGNLALGSDRQVRSNPDADDESDQDIFTTGTFTIRNAGPNPLTGITVTPAVALGSASDYNFSLTGAPLSLVPGASATVSVRARVPETLDAVDDDARKAAPLAARLTVTGTMAGTTLSKTSDVTMEAENQLEIKKLKVCVNGSCDTLRDGDKVDDLKPGDRVDVTFKVENKYKDNPAEDLEILDVNAFILVDESAFDVDEDDEIGDISPEGEEEVTLSFDVEDDAEDGSVTMLSWVEGEDENGARHGELFEIELDVKRERHEVSLRDVRLEPDTVSCNAGGDQTVALSLELQNTGRDDEDEAAVEVENSDLGISKVERDIKIDQDDREDKSYTLSVPSDARPGVYALSIKSFTRRDDLSDSEDALLTVPTCAPAEPETPESEEPGEEETDEEIVVVTGPPPDETPALPAPTGAVAAPVTSSSGKMTSNDGMYVALLVAIIVVLVIIGAMLVNALAKRN